MSAACTNARLYRSRDPRTSVLYQLVERFYEQVKGEWEERFEGACGFWRGFVDDIVNRYLGCGLYSAGFARAYCDSCKAEFLVAFSCQSRGFCPSCAAKRAAMFGALLVDEVLEDVPHAM